MSYLPIFMSKNIKELFFGIRNKNIIIFLAILLPNFFAAVLEGLSFSCILMAFTVLEGNAISFAKSLPPAVEGLLSTCLNYFDQSSFFSVFIIGAICFQILKSGFSYLGQIASTYLGTRIQIEAQRKVYGQILRFSFSCVSNYKVGDLVEYAKTPATLIHVVIDALNRTIVSGFAIVASIVVMLLLSPPLTFVAIVVFGLFALGQKFVIRRICTISRSLSDQTVDFSKHTVQSLHGLRAIHTFSRQANVLERIRFALDKIAETTKKLNLWNHSIPPVNEVMGIVVVGAFIIIGQFFMKNSQISALPILLTFITVVYRLSSRVQILLGGIAAIAGNWGHILRLEEILSEKGKEFSASGGVAYNGLEEAISFHNVSLQYPTAEKCSVHETSLSIPKGSTIGFVGSSGAGKSSVVDLLLRLYEPTSGRICVDNQDLCNIEIGSWRDNLGVVSQDTFIFNDTIEENIRFGKLDASFEEICEAARTAGAHDFISRLPRGYQTVVGERGYRLSGGERQRVALSRALVRNPEILILDEATSSLDSESERLIQEALDKFHGKKTIIIVAHRLSTIANADKIIVMDNGKLIESGTHAELLAQGERYAFFWQIQSRQSNNENGEVQSLLNAPHFSGF